MDVKYNEKNATFHYGDPKVKEDEVVVVCNMMLMEFSRFFDRCAKKYPIFSHRTNRDKFYHPTAQDIKDEYEQYVSDMIRAAKKEEELQRKQSEERALMAEKNRIMAEKREEAKRRKAANKKPIRKILIKDGEQIDLVITKDICIGKNKVKGIEVVQRVKVNLGQAIIPMDRNKLATVDFIINKIGDAIL